MSLKSIACVALALGNYVQIAVGGARYFLVVKARIGWNRWVSSEFVEFTADVPKK